MKKSHIPLSIFCFCICIAIVLGGCSGPKNDEGFLKNLGSGLNSRWKISNANDSKEYTSNEEYRNDIEKCINAELDAIGDLSEYEFTDANLKEQATEYYAALQNQLAGIKYYGNNDEQYWALFESGRQERAHILYLLDRDYEIPVPKNQQETLNDMVLEGQSLEELYVGLDQYEESLSGMTLEKTSSSMYTGTITNLSNIIPDFVEIDLTGYDENGQIIDTAMTQINNWQTGNTQAVEFWTNNANFASATASINFWYNNDMRQTDEIQIEVIDNMQINIAMPKFPVESKHITYDNTVRTRCLVTDASYTVKNWINGKAESIELQLSGEKIFDIEDDELSRACQIGWKLYDNTNAVVDSGTLYTVDLKVGERFLNSSSYITASLDPGDYRLEILNVED